MKAFRDCTRCGDCCSQSPCGIAMATIGHDTPCKALEDMGGGVFGCGLILHPSKYMDNGEYAPWKDEFLGGVFAKMLGVGMGCCASPETESFAKILTQFHGKKVSFQEALELQLMEMGKQC